MTHLPLVEELNALFESLDKLLDTIKESAYLSFFMAGMNALAWSLFTFLLVNYYWVNVFVNALATFVFSLSLLLSILLIVYGLRNWRFYQGWKKRFSRLKSIEAEMLKGLESTE
jgi:hypothetical protein